MISQYGWQFETSFAEGMNTGLVEVVAPAGGMEQRMLLPSISSLIGVRQENMVLNLPLDRIFPCLDWVWSQLSVIAIKVVLLIFLST